MKTIAALLLALTLFSATGCESSTQYGECVGVSDRQNTKLQYKLSVRNTILAVVFFQTIFAPIVYFVSDFYCPVGPAQ